MTTLVGMAGDEPTPVEVEAHVSAELKKVRFVFETGFPEDLVIAARRVVKVTSQRQTLYRDGHVRFPACLALAVVAAARDYNGREFWTGPDLRAIGLTGQAVPDWTLRALSRLGLETFPDVVLAENALRRLTPVLMHAGLPGPNVPDLVSLIISAQRQRLLSASEQIAAWSRLPSGFRGLWRAPQLFLKYGGSAAIDLLERFLDALGAPDPTASGLPSHLVRAIESLDRHTVDDAVRSRGPLLRRPMVVFDPWSCSGPAVRLSANGSSAVTHWRVGGTQIAVTGIRVNGSDVALSPERLWEVQALSGDDLIARWNFPAFDRSGVIFFDARSGRLLRMLGSRREAESDRVLALLDDRYELCDAIETGNSFPELVGAWSGWRVVELDVPQVTTLVCQERGRGESAEVVTLVPMARRPAVSERCEVLGACGREGQRVFRGAPSLEVHLGAVAPELVVVGVMGPTGARAEVTLAALGDGPVYSLSSLVTGPGDFIVDIRGPLGLRMAATGLTVVPDLTVELSPQVAFADDVVEVTVASASSRAVVSAPPSADSIDVLVDGVVLRVTVPRVAWNLRLFGELGAPFTQTQVQLAVDDLVPDVPPLLSVAIGHEIESALELWDATGRVARWEPPRRTDHWSMALDRWRDTVEHTSSESLEIRLIVGGRRVTVGRIISLYVSGLSELHADGEISPPTLEAQLEENRPFRKRVVRMWNLERPWESSRAFPVPDDQRSHLRLVLPESTKNGFYRVWLRVEEAWASEPSLPRQGDGVADVRIESGRALDPDDATDRIVASLRPNSPIITQPVDLETLGHFVVARLAQGLEANGPRWLADPIVGRALNLLHNDAPHLPRHLWSALRSGFVAKDNALFVAVAVLPTLLQLEREIDLHLPDDVAEEMWSSLPLAAACIDSWSDSPESCERWMRHLGWPSLNRQPTTPEGSAFDEPTGLNLDTLPGVQRELVKTFKRMVETARGELGESPELRKIRNEVTGLSDKILSVDTQFREIFDILLDLPRHLASDWIASCAGTLGRVHTVVQSSEELPWVESLAAGERGSEWVLADIAALAVALVREEERATDAHRALLEAIPEMPTWVAHCLLAVISRDHRRHRGLLAPTYAVKENNA